MNTYRVAVLACILTATTLPGMEKVTFPAADGLAVTADLYLAHDKGAPFVILFHQAGYSRGEYGQIAPRLNGLGFNALAVDQRSGGAAKGVMNETAALARARGLRRGYLDALPDLEAAIAWARSSGNAAGRLVLWGSSYSASLVLKLAGEQPGLCDAVLAFSPGEYFSGRDFIAKSARGITVPVFVTSAPGERDDWAAIFEAIPSAAKSSFLPERGVHGSSTLWSETSGNEASWKAVEAFLAGLPR